MYFQQKEELWLLRLSCDPCVLVATQCAVHLGAGGLAVSASLAAGCPTLQGVAGDTQVVCNIQLGMQLCPGKFTDGGIWHGCNQLTTICI